MSNQRGPLPGATGSGRPPRGDPRRAQAAATAAGAEIAVPGFANIPRTGQSMRLAPPEAPSGLSTGTVALWATLFTSCPWLDVEKDQTAVEQLCRLVDDIAACRAAIEEHGLLISESVPDGGRQNHRRRAKTRHQPCVESARRVPTAPRAVDGSPWHPASGTSPPWH